MSRLVSCLSPAAVAAIIAAATTASAAEECGSLKRITSVDTVAGPAGYMLVPVNLGDARRLLLFDTGGAISSITPAAAAELHLSTYDTRVKMVGVSGAVSTRATVIPSVRIGATESKGAQYMVLPDNMPGLAGGGVVGTLAPATGVDIDLDFANRRLSFFSPDHCDGKVVYWQAPAVAIVPMRIAGLQQGGTPSTEHIIIPVSLDGKQLNALIDTGAANNVLNLAVAEDRFDIRPDSPDVQEVGQLGKSASAKVYRRQFHALSFEGVTVTNPEIDLVPDQMTRSIGDQRRTGSLTRPTDTGLPDLIIGMPVLIQTHMYIAFRERKVYVTSAGDARADVSHSPIPPTDPAFRIAGSWKINAPGIGPVCDIVQIDANQTGVCTGPQAQGQLSGTIAGSAIQWQWTRTARATEATTTWNFSGSMPSGNTIAGFAEQRGRYVAFTATRQ